MSFRILFAAGLLVSGTMLEAQSPPAAPPAPRPVIPVPAVAPNFTPAPVSGFNSAPVQGFSPQPVSGFRTSPLTSPNLGVPPPSPNLAPQLNQNPVSGFNPDPVGGFISSPAPELSQPQVVAEPAPVSALDVAPATSAFTNASGTVTNTSPPLVSPSPF